MRLLSGSLLFCRRVFVNFSYFLFFHSVVVGLTSCLFRLARSIVLGAWLVGRIDRPVMPKGYEQCDAGKSLKDFTEEASSTFT